MTILLIEDNLDHVFLSRRAIEDAMGKSVSIHHLENADGAMEWLRNSESRRPDLVLLDLQLPGRDGFSLVREMKSDPGLRSIPVVIFSCSSADCDVLEGYESGSNLYVCKPTGPDAFAERVGAIPRFFKDVANLPPRAKSESRDSLLV